jgi:glucokinase
MAAYNATVAAMTLVGVDFGGTRIKAGAVRDGAIERSDSIDTRAGAQPAAIFDAIAEMVKRLDLEPSSLGVAIPGECDVEGRCYRLPNVPGFEGVPIAAELARRLGCRVVVENDATTAALGEMLHGHGRKHASFVMVTLGTGIGGGVVIDRRVRRGSHGFGGEIGHVPIDRSPDAPLCNCGLRGCVEAFAGASALLGRYAALGGNGAREVRDIAEAAARGEPAAQRVFEEMGVALGLMLTAVQNVLDLDAIVFSGGVSTSFERIEPTIRSTLRDRAHGPPLGEVPLLVSELGERAGVVGAAHLATNHIF